MFYTGANRRTPQGRRRGARGTRRTRPIDDTAAAARSPPGAKSQRVPPSHRVAGYKDVAEGGVRRSAQGPHHRRARRRPRPGRPRAAAGARRPARLPQRRGAARTRPARPPVSVAGSMGRTTPAREAATHSDTRPASPLAHAIERPRHSRRPAQCASRPRGQG